MNYQLFIEGREVEIDTKLGIQLTLVIDDISKFSSRNTSFSKTLVIPGTKISNAIFGHIHELGSANEYSPGSTNIGVNFNVAQTSRAELRMNGLLLMKGVFRLTGIVKVKNLIEYEGSIFGELGGFMAAIGNGKLEDLNFAEYNHEYNTTNITDSWDAVMTKSIGIANFNASDNTIEIRGNYPSFYVGLELIISGTGSNDGTFTVSNVRITPNQFLVYTTYVTVEESLTNEAAVGFTIEYSSWGSGYYYPLIDHGNYSDSNKVNYQIGTFRPALFVKEYLDKIFTDAGYTYESEFFNTDMFRRLIVPSNKKDLTALGSLILESGIVLRQELYFPVNPAVILTWDSYKANNFSYNSGQFTYTQPNTSNVYVNFSASGVTDGDGIVFQIRKNGVLVESRTNRRSNNEALWGFDINFTAYFSMGQNDVIDARIYAFSVSLAQVVVGFSADMRIETEVPVSVLVTEGDDVDLNETIPKNIFQKDFFSWILKMFNLYVYEDKLNDKKLIIKPYKDYYQTEGIDWTYKIARDKAWNISPMGLLNGRFFEFKFKEDNDFFNENYKKKYNQSYGDRLEDTGFQFAKDKQTNEIGFSPTVLVQYGETDKVVPAIYKKSGENEDRMDSNIRILLAKKITGVAEWDILDGDTVLENNLTVYGYAGHFDDPADPTVDINFGAANEIYFTPNSYTPNNLYNVYWSGYISEIADKDSKVLKAYVYLTPFDIAKMDFSVPVIIDGVLWRVNKIEDFDMNELTKVELLKVINNG